MAAPRVPRLGGEGGRRASSPQAVFNQGKDMHVL